jgi:hypothetical protein
MSTADGESSGIATSTWSGTAERDTEPCAAPAPVLYDELIDELLAARVAAGGALSAESESAFVERLDDLWWQMTDDEQHAWNAEAHCTIAVAGVLRRP